MIAPEPLTILFAACCLGIAWSEKFIRCVTGALVRFHNQPAAFDRDADLHSRPQAQKVKQCGPSRLLEFLDL